MRTLKTTIAFVMTACMLLFLAACGEKGPDVTGKYICVGESYSGESYSEPYSESWVELKKGGKGTYYSGTEFDLEWKLKGESIQGSVTFMGMENIFEGTLKDGVIDIQYQDLHQIFVKDGTEGAPSGEEAAPTGSAHTASGEKAAVAATLLEAFAGAGGASPGSAGIQNPSEWSGWLTISEVWGMAQDEDNYAAWAVIDRVGGTGKPYIEVFQEGDPQNAFLSMYIILEDDGTRVVPDIGVEDAWTVDVYLDPENAKAYEGRLDGDGALTFDYDYVSQDGSYGCHVAITLR